MQERQTNQKSVVDIFSELLKENGIEKKQIEYPTGPQNGALSDPFEIIQFEDKRRDYEEKRLASAESLLKKTNTLLWLYGSNVKTFDYDWKNTIAYREIGPSQTPAITVKTAFGDVIVQAKGEFKKNDEKYTAPKSTKPTKFSIVLVTEAMRSEVILEPNNDFSFDKDKLPSLEDSLRAGMALGYLEKGLEEQNIPKNPMGGYTGGYH